MFEKELEFELPFSFSLQPLMQRKCRKLGLGIKKLEELFIFGSK
jgi:hypothetical protein